MARLDFPDCPSPGPATEPTGLRASSSNSGALSLPDLVPWDCPGTQEIGFTIAERYNASAVLFDNLVGGRGERPAVIGPAGGRTYAGALGQCFCGAWSVARRPDPFGAR